MKYADDNTAVFHTVYDFYTTAYITVKEYIILQYQKSCSVLIRTLPILNN